ncbi:MAG: hypothetical protein II839_03295, partial [Kiritimatiellae bacterium]|nr:hypothetical protein [Kiritimatiellia bacterium]
MSDLLSRLSSAPLLALDTEFVWNRTYYAKLGLVQAAADDASVLARLPSAPPAAMPFRAPAAGE